MHCLWCLFIRGRTSVRVWRSISVRLCVIQIKGFCLWRECRGEYLNLRGNSNRVEDIVTYSEEYHVEILSVAVCQLLLGWPNEKRKGEKNFTPKIGRPIYVSLHCKWFQFGGRKYLRYKMSRRTMRKLLYTTGSKLFLEIKKRKTK
jgi:hypothetical protein